MKRLYLNIIILVCFTAIIKAQPYVDGGKTRFRFAQLNAGFDYRTILSKGSESFSINSSGSLERYELKSQGDARLIIGGTHFWGHADFYMAFPLKTFGKNGFKIAEEIGAKCFPWRIESKKIRPYLGMAVLTYDFKQGNGVTQVRTRYPVTGGLVFNYKRSLIDLEGGYLYNNKEKYYITPTTSIQIKTRPYWISFAYKLMIDMTLPEEKDWISGKTKKITDSLAVIHLLKGFTLAMGPSASFFLKSSPHNENTAPYLGSHKVTNVFPEFCLGYYLYKPDLQLNISYRNMKSELKAYDFTQLAKRRALTFETYKFICDFNGFDAFLGPAVSYEWLSVSETDRNGFTYNGHYDGVKPGITFGWDIRPNSLQMFYLRTNLRYFPNLNVKMNDNKNVSFDQLEFNFIQLVFFPERLSFPKKISRATWYGN
jgi:hypothetical protein